MRDFKIMCDMFNGIDCETTVLTDIGYAIETVYKNYYESDRIPDQMLHLSGEMRELLEALKQDKQASVQGIQKYSQSPREKKDYEDWMKNTIQDEITDILIVALGLASFYNMDVEAWIFNKMYYNRLRGNHD